MRMRGAVKKAVQFRKSENNPLDLKIIKLKDDLLNSPCHIFGEHNKCSDYFCKGPKDSEKNYLNDFKRSGLFPQILNIVSYLAKFSKSLFYEMTNNLVEHFNALIAKKNSGKRINYFSRRSYQTRCELAAIFYATKGHVQSLTRQTKNTPSIFTTNMENRRQRKVLLAREKRNKTKSFRKKIYAANDDDEHYGPNCIKPDMEPKIIKRKMDIYLENLKVDDTKQQQILETTVSQSDSLEWREERRKRIGSSMFGRICNMLPYTSCEKIVSNMLYNNKKLSTPAITWGKEHEKTAILTIEKELNVKIEPSGLFIDKDNAFLCTTPDGLIGDDGIVEVNCPYSARHMSHQILELSSLYLFFHEIK